MSVQFALLAVARTSAASVPDEIDAATARATAAGHKILTEEIVADSEAVIRDRLAELIANPEIDVVLVLAGAESDAASKALKPLVSEVLPGFTDLFRWLMFQEAGASAMLSAAEAAQCGSTLVFVLPGAIEAAMEKLILPQFDPKTTPRNLVDKLPRLHTEAVPQPIAVEKTQGGSGIHTRLPAIPSGRLRSRTGANVVHREQPIDDPTKPIDLEKLEHDLAASTPTELLASDDATRPMDLGTMLPAVPPGADPDAYAPDTDDDHTDVTLAAPPPPQLFPRTMAIPSIAKPPPRANPTGARGISPSTPPRITNPSASPVRRDAMLTSAAPMPAVTITPRSKKPGPAKPDPVKPLDAKTQAIEAQRAKDATTSAEARKRALTPKPISVMPRPTDREQQPAAAKRDTGRNAAIVPDAATVAAPDKTVEPKYGDPVTPAESPVAAAAKSARRDATDVDEQAATHGEISEPDGPTTRRTPDPADDLDGRPTVRVVPSESPLAKINGAAIHAASDLDAAETVDGMKAVGNSTEALEKIDQEDLIDAADDASPAEIRSVLMKDIAPAPNPRARPITEPPPPPTRRAPSAPPVVAKRAPTAPPPARASVDDLPRGNFAYPVKKPGTSLTLKLLLAAVVLGAGFFAVVFIFRDKEPAATKPPEPAHLAVTTPPPDAEIAPPDAAVVEPDIEMDPTPVTNNPPKPNPPKTNLPKPNPPKPNPPKSGSTTPTNPATPPPPDTAVAPPVDDDCDETSCVLSKYDRACCAKYKPATTDFKPRVGDVPESLDKSMVRAAVERVKPRVVTCGEKAGVKGTVKIALGVAPDGSVTSASVTDSPDPALGECVLGAMKSAKFGKTVNGASFTYPFAF